MVPLSGPMFEAAKSRYWQSLMGKTGAHYNHYVLVDDELGMEALRDFFPDAKADEMNFVLFSTSGIHGTYQTIEESQEELKDGPPVGITFVIVQPRLVSVRYGNATPRNQDDIDFLKRLRQSSWDVVQGIGRPEKEVS
jgi:hypothetical protein